MSELSPLDPPDFAILRIEYMLHSLSEEDVLENPVEQFVRWLNQAIEAEAHEPNAMMLATATPEGIPSARMVLLKGVDETGFVFFTNYLSQKGHELEQNPRASLLFYWPELERQVRVDGAVSKTTRAESVQYFESRPTAARLGSAASPQSQPVASRQALESLQKALLEQYPNGHVPCPEHWGGYRLRPHRLELWQGRPSRLHDRVEYLIQADGKWARRRLAP